MAKQKIQQSTLYTLGLIVLAFVLIKGGGAPFLESFVTTCTNLELETSDEFVTYYSNYAVIRTLSPVPYVIQAENATITHYLSSVHILTNETDLVMLSKDGLSCSDYIKYVKETSIEPVTDTIYYNQKVGTDFNGTVYWCNAGNTVTFKGTREDFVSYVDEFIICAITEIPDAVESDIGEDEDNETIEDDDYVGGTTTTTTTTTGTTATTTPTYTATTPAQDDLTKNRVIFGLVIIAIGFAVYYLGYEQGPKRGFIRKR